MVQKGLLEKEFLFILYANELIMSFYELKLAVGMLNTKLPLKLYVKSKNDTYVIQQLYKC